MAGSGYRSKILQAAQRRAQGSFGDLGPGELAVEEWRARGLALPDIEALRAYRLARVRAQLAQRDYAAILVADPINVRYATDSANMQVWCLHNPVRYAFVATEGPVIVFDFHGSAHLSAHLDLVDEVRPGARLVLFQERSARGRARRDLGGRDRGSDRCAWRRQPPARDRQRRSRGRRGAPGAGPRACTTARRSWSWPARSSRRTRSRPCAARSRPARRDARDAGAAARRASPSRRSGRICTPRTSRAAASGSRPGCWPRARAPTPGSRSAAAGRSRRATWWASTPI